MTMRLETQKEQWKEEVSSAIFQMVEKSRIAHTEAYQNDEENVAKKIDRIRGKLESGEALSQSDLRYLRKYAPQLYAFAMRVQMKREAVEEQCKHARTKAEVHEIHFTNITMIAKEDPAKEYVIAAVNRVVTEFKNTEQYKRLPEQTEDDKEKKLFVSYDAKGHIKDEMQELTEGEEQEVFIRYDMPNGNYQETYLVENVLSFNKIM